MKTDRIYSAWSEVNAYGVPGILYPLVNQSIEHNWFCDGRTEPLLPHEEAISNFADLTPEQQEQACRYVDGFFSREEVGSLRSYLWDTRQWVVHSWEVGLPFEWTDDLAEHSVCRDVSQAYSLSGDTGYSLLIQVHSTGQTDVGPALIYLSKAQEEAALRFATSLLQRINVYQPASLRWIVNDICRMTNLCVVDVEQSEADWEFEVDRERTVEAWREITSGVTEVRDGSRTAQSDMDAVSARLESHRKYAEPCGKPRCREVEDE